MDRERYTNMNEWNEEREIDLIKVLWDMAEQWKPILVVAILCACLTAGVMYMRQSQSYEAAVTVQQSETAEDIRVRLTDEELEAVDSAVGMFREKSEYQAYRENSLLYQINANEEHYLTVLYRITASDAEGIYDRYAMNLRSNAFLGDFAGAIQAEDADSKYVAELVRVSMQVPDIVTPYSAAMNRIQAQVLEADGGFTFCVDMILPSDADVATVEKLLDDYVCRDLYKIIGEDTFFEIEKTDSVSGTRVDSALTSAKTSARSSLASVESALTTATDKFTDDQNALYQKLIAPEGGDSVGETVESAADTGMTSGTVSTEAVAKPGISKKYIGLGFLIGIVLYGGLLLMLEIFKKTISTGDELSSVYGLRVLEDIHQKKYSSAGEKFIHSSFVYGLRHKKEEKDIDRRIDNLQASVKSYVEHKNLEGGIVFVPVGKDAANNSAIVQKLVALSDGAPSDAALSGGPLLGGNEDASLVLVVRDGISTFAELQELLVHAHDYDRTVLGVVAVEE